MSLVETHGITKIYKSGDDDFSAIQDITIEIKQGEFVAVNGPSGSGKSTLLTIFGGLNNPTRGKVIIDDIDIYSLSVEQLANFRREYIGFVFQSFQLISYLTVLENVMLSLVVTDYSKVEKKQKSNDILKKVGLIDKEDRLPDELSGGEQERVAIARALVNQPPIILADEPTGNLDTETGEDIMRLFQDLNEDGQTIVMVTHNPENIKYAGRVISLRDGFIIDTDLFINKQLISRTIKNIANQVV
ncbi:MAG: ABC transporter ATP-binding protein [Calditrichia bacterium]